MRNLIILLLMSFSSIQRSDAAVEDPKSKLPEIIFLNNRSASADSMVIPFSRAGNLILVQATADTTIGNFILDTGCPHLVLNLTYFRQYATQSEASENMGMTGTVSNVSQALIRSFRLGEMQYNRLEADLVNLGHIENSKGVKILGLIGMQLLNQFEMIIDFEKNLIHLRKVSRKNGNKNLLFASSPDYEEVPIELVNDRIIVKTEIAGKKLKLIIDSGAESNILDSRLPDKIFEQVSITGRILITGAGNKKVEALRGDWKSLKIGSQSIASLPVVVTNLEKTCFSYNGCVDGVLGFDFLSQQKIGFNFVTRKMYIWK